MSNGNTIDVVEFGGFRLDRRKRRLTNPAGEAIALKTKVFDTLALLAAHPDEVLDKRAIFEAVWPDVTVEENNLNQAISVLRRALGDSRDEPCFIATVHGRGYRFVAPVQAVLGRAPSPAAESGSVAVLPFRNLSPDAEQEYFVDGLSEELINRLHQLPGLRVIGRTSSFAYRNHDGDLRRIGKALGVQSLLEGGVRKGDGCLRVSARLVDAGSGFLRWSETYDRPDGDALAIQEDIARAVAEASSAALVAEDVDPEVASDPFFGMGPKRPGAYDLYLRATGLIARGGRENVLGAAQLLRRAITLDRAFLEARLLLARTLYSVTIYSTERATVVDPEIAAIEDGVIAEAPREWIKSWLLARRRLIAGDWLGCSESLAAARAKAPPGARPRLDEVEVGLSLAVGRIAVGLDYFLARLRDDPLSTHDSWMAQRVLDLAGRGAEADAEHGRSCALSPGHRSILAVAAMLRALGQADPVAVEVTVADYLAGDLAHDGDRVYHAVRHDRAAALALLAQQIARAGEPGAMVPVYAAALAARHGDIGLALLGIRTFLRMLSTETMSLWLPALAPARKDPRFKDIARDFGLLAYWRATGKWGDFCRPLGEDDFECS